MIFAIKIYIVHDYLTLVKCFTSNNSSECYMTDLQLSDVLILKQNIGIESMHVE